STPAPSLGKNVAGGTLAHRPRVIHSRSIEPPFERGTPYLRRRRRIGSHFLPESSLRTSMKLPRDALLAVPNRPRQEKMAAWESSTPTPTPTCPPGRRTRHRPRPRSAAR